MYMQNCGWRRTWTVSTLSNIIVKINSQFPWGRATNQAVGHPLLTGEARVQSHSNSRDMRCAQTGTTVALFFKHFGLSPAS